MVQSWIAANVVRLIVSGLGISVLLGSCMLRDASLKNKGAADAVTRIEKATSNAAKIGTAAARKSLDSRVRGIRDPSTRND